MKKAFDVEIMGERLTVRSDAEEGYVRKVASYVDNKMEEALKTVRPLAKSNAAMLAALNIADEYHQLKEKYEVMLQRLNHLSKKLLITLSEEG